MTSRLRLMGLVVIGAAGGTGGLAAQVRGLPVRNAGVGTGIGIAADIGFPNGDAGKGIAVGATGAIGLGPLGVTGTVATWNPRGSGPSVNSVGVTGNLKIFGGPLIPVSVTAQVGAAYDRQSQTSSGLGGEISTKTLHVPLGVGLALTIPNPVFSIKPWLAPRVDVTRVTFNPGDTPAETDTRAKFGISGGVDLGFLSGLTIRAMYDRMSAGGGISPSVLSVGLGFKVGT